MNAAVKALWLKALRSGRYQQGHGCLHFKEPDVEQFCCLGVLCEVAVQEGALPPGKAIAKDGGTYFHYGRASDDAILPQEVREWAEIETGDGGYYGEGSKTADRSLASDNDNGVVFEDIADIIEAKF